MASNSLEELNSISLQEILEQDSRPTFVIDLDPDDFDNFNTTDVIAPIFCNAALRSHDLLLDAVTGEALGGTPENQDTTPYCDFKSWATGLTKFDDSMDVYPLSFLYTGMLWTGSTLRKRWRLISGNRYFQISNVASSNLSSGPLPEVATGGSIDLMLDKHNADGVPPLQSNGSVDPSSQAYTSPTSSTKTTLVSSNQRRASGNLAPKNSGGSSDDTGNTSSITSIRLAVPENVVSDWTAPRLTGNVSSHVLFTRKIEWASTPLGSMDTWSPEFRQVANLLMGNPHPAALFWGEDLTVMYNEAYRDVVAGRKHPDLMGTGFQGPFSELWDDVGPFFAECARTGQSVRKENQRLPIERRGYLEETFFSWSITPLYGGTGRILGFYNAPFETTQNEISARRTQTLHRLGEKLAHARTVKDFWKRVLEGLEENHFDVPFALLYSVVDLDDDGVSSSLSSSGSSMSLKSCMFEGSIAVPRGHPAAQPKLDLKRSGEGFIPSFREAMRTREPTNLQTRDGTLPEILLEGTDWRGFGEPCREATIFPVRPTNGETVLAFLLVGVNPRRAYDDEYKGFTTMLNRQLATSLASVMLFEDEVRRSRNAIEAAALEQEQLSQQLAVQTSRLQRMTAHSPLGMFYISPDGVILEANDRYYEMTGCSRDNIYEMSFMEQLVDGSVSTMEDGWHKLVVDRMPWSAELQLKRPYGASLASEAEPIDYWVVATSQPEFASDGSLRSIMGSITDISHLKWAEGLQNRRLQEAEETRRQQNEFIDITSHEMRNPLSAILQCADDISSSLSEFKVNGINPAKVIGESIDAAKTIALCVQHQKSIVDDILTVSKLDCNLLLITPVPVQAVAVAQRAVKMFDPELQSKDIQMQFDVGSSLQKLEIDWVALDPSRLLQILINLMTNAIKFTQAQAKRFIIVRVAASLRLPYEDISGFQFIPPKNPKSSLSFGEDWGPGELLYLYFEVQDSGCGLTPDEMQVLFKRFSQATPRTHAQYGGSGLGLFISRQLTELHGGQIGVGSQAGVGSTFGFYIKVRRSSRPSGNTPQLVAPLVNDSQRHGSLDQMIPLEYVESLPDRPATSEERLRLDPKELHVLVVEDNLVNQKVLMKQLQKVGCTVAVACHGKEALAHLEETEFQKQDGCKLSVILMDLEMPEMDGLTCVRVIRSMEAEGTISKHVPVIAVTANVRQEQIEAAKESGMDDVMSKPFRIPELLAKVEMVLSG